MAPLALTSATSTTQAMLAAYVRRAEDWRRDHLGASLLGHGCLRYLWLSFRWVMAPGHSGKQLRLFERGNRAETWLIEDLRAADVEVWDRDPNTGEQFRVKWHGHLGGGLDGVVIGLLESPSKPHLLECKSHGSKSFARLLEKGVKGSKPEHYAQMQAYMLGMDLECAFYLAVNKDTDELYAERVRFDRAFAEQLVAKGKSIIDAAEPAPPLEAKDYPPCVYTSKDGTRWPCQFYDQCHGDRVVPEKNCRTCASSTPMPDGTWACDLHHVLDSSKQRAGCSSHLTIPALFNAQPCAVNEAARKITYQFADGRTHTDGGMQ